MESIARDPIITNNYETGFSSRSGEFNLSASYYISTSKLGANLVYLDEFLVPQREPENNSLDTKRLGYTPEALIALTFVPVAYTRTAKDR